VKVEWSGPALAFLRARAARIRRDRPLAARRWLAETGGAVERLASLPPRGRAIPELPMLDVREVVAGGCRIFHRAEPTRVYVIGVQHSRQEFDLVVDRDADAPESRAAAACGEPAAADYIAPATPLVDHGPG